MDKLKMHTSNKADENFRKLAAMFPNAVTETINENGEVVRAIDKDVLMQEISCTVVDGNEERYQFTWPDKKKSVLLANAPINKTLRPCREESVDFDTTENLYIEGDNLEVLKLLQETYLGKIKMIYIDPPYNTGSDFVYEDDFAQSTDEYLANSGQFDEDGNRMVQNTESNGRFHTDWLNMMYTRIRVAKDLLTDDGLIFISIDDYEVENLRKLCNEIFGESNFVNQVIWIRNSSGKTVSKQLTQNIEYLLIYAKSSNFELNPVFKPLAEATVKMYSKDDNDGRGKYRLYPLQKPASPGPETTYDYVDNTGRVWKCPPKGWRMKESKLRALENDGRLCMENGTLSEKAYWNERTSTGRLADTYWDDMPENSVGTKEVSSLFDGKVVFSNPKPIEYLTRMLKAQTSAQNEDYILDFFSGSASLAHAVMQLNASDNGNRRFIMVQIPEETEEKTEAYKLGYKTICEIGKERIRRAGKKIQEERLEAIAFSKHEWDQTCFYVEHKEECDRLGHLPDEYFAKEHPPIDTGFRVLKCDTSNMKEVYYNPAEYEASLFSSLEDNIKEDRTPEDLLFQVMLDLGVLLSSKIEETTIAGKKVFNVEDNYLIACFDSDVTEETIKAIAKQKPYYFVMRDSSMASDSVATNFDQIFATYSPDTVRKVL